MRVHGKRKEEKNNRQEREIENLPNFGRFGEGLNLMFMQNHHQSTKNEAATSTTTIFMYT